VVLVGAGAGSGFDEFFCAVVANSENIVKRKSETRSIPPWCAHSDENKNKAFRVKSSVIPAKAGI
jgi:hypothetical protein